jgi:hypothetical protein
MARPEKPVNATGGAVAAFASELRRLRAQAGNPTYRDMARSALFSSSVLSSAASGSRLPTLQVALGFVAACGGDREAWRRRWLEVSGGITPKPSPRPRYQDFSARQGLPRPAQLPLRPRGFVGRRAELRWLSAPAAITVVISGPAGVGKSEFALHYAHRVAADMVDGQLYADFGPLTSAPPDSAHVLDGFLRALGVPADQVPSTLDQRAGLYRSLLAERSLVVLLDNVRDERQVRPLLAETRRSMTLVVSRSPLLGLRHVRRVRLDVLSREDSITMITAALPGRAAAEPHECDRLAELCGDLPLALDIALRKLAARPNMPLRRVTGNLVEPEELLDWFRIGDQSVRESLNSVHVNLGEPAKALLAGIARRRPGGDLTMLPQGEEDLLDELVEAGMLRIGDQLGGYRLEPLVYAFAIGAGTSEHVEVPAQKLGLEAGRDRRTVLAGDTACAN